jgi:hypothetical protein
MSVRPEDRRASALAALAIVLAAAGIMALAIVLTRESREERLAGSLAAEKGESYFAGCTEQKSGDWLYCGPRTIRPADFRRTT